MALPVIIDCDPGVDDAIALLLALGSPELTLLGITTVAGNVPLSLTTENARRICQLANRQVPVYAGCPRPLLRPLLTAEHVHGATGLAGTPLPQPTHPLGAQHAVNFLIEQLQEAEAGVTLAMLGPLTNLALALVQAPEIIQNIERVVIMGGAITRGNVTASAEFNIYVDPHAADIVATAGLPITLISLDVTHQAVTTPARLQRIRDLGTEVAAAAADLLAYYGQLDCEKFNLEGAPLHDPCVIAYMLNPEIFKGRPMELKIETSSPLTLGRTVVDPQAEFPNAQILEHIDSDKFYNLLTERLGKL